MTLLSFEVHISAGVWSWTLSSWIEWHRMKNEAIKIGPWVARKRRAFWEARFAVAVANCNASMILKSLSAYH